MEKRKQSRGAAGERLISEFFDAHFTSLFAFPNPKTTTGAEVADVLVWWNHVVLLVEVKTRDGGGKDANDWARSMIRRAVNQIEKNYSRIQNNERINLHNGRYQVPLDYTEELSCVGLVILIPGKGEEINAKPTDAVPDIYEKDLPVHVFAWNDLQQMKQEIDTVFDLELYLQDRRKFMKKGNDIPLNREIHALGWYKLNKNAFSSGCPNLTEHNTWDVYSSKMAEEIEARDSHNQKARLFDKIAAGLPRKRGLFNDIPLGLYIDWELGGLTRRQRTEYGQKLASVEGWFAEGRKSRRFALHNQATGNWIVFYYSTGEPKSIADELKNLVHLKALSLYASEQQVLGIYGLGFQVTRTTPFEFGVVESTFFRAEETSFYTSKDVEEAFRTWGDSSTYSRTAIEEFL